MARLNICSGCNWNFASVTAHTEHRTGKFGVDRRCMTSEEMQAKGFMMSIEPVTRRIEGKASTSQMETWFTPMSEQERARLTAMRERSQNDDDDTDDEEE